MKKTLVLLFSVTLCLASCQIGPEERRAELMPLPEKVTPRPYGQLLERARGQASRANDAFYRDNWNELEEHASGLETTAQFLAKADDVPAKHKDTFVTTSGDLGKLARQLKEAATSKSVDKVTDIMKSINLKVREMRLSDSPER
jgi:hypothetical protein